MGTEKLVWEQGQRTAKVTFTIPYVGKLVLEVELGDRETAEERKALAFRQAKLLVRNLANTLDLQ